MNEIIYPPENAVWKHFNGLLLSNDLGRIRKLLVRYELFQKSATIPGDIVECGVFKGVGMMYWRKLLEIYLPGTSKQVVGFDTFTSYADSFQDFEAAATGKFVQEANFQGVTVKELQNFFNACGLGSKIEFVAGDIQQTALAYATANRGFRISLLNLDLDTYAGTKAALETFYPLVSRGGVIVFDEYGKRGWGESDAVDEYFADFPDIQIQSVPYAEFPTAYLVKN